MLLYDLIPEIPYPFTDWETEAHSSKTTCLGIQGSWAPYWQPGLVILILVLRRPEAVPHTHPTANMYYTCMTHPHQYLPMHMCMPMTHIYKPHYLYLHMCTSTESVHTHIRVQITHIHIL